ncbi:Amuc_1100 family pilus-like protein [Kiritimatiellaeota bacterium B1221]|nr:Amuc_1100 family pilus-like protein [Kiritimatiellaeota bacterium B1221]
MNWTRYKLLIISGGICLIVSGGLTFWALSTKSKNAEVDNKIQNLNSRQASLMAKKPYPSQQNFETLKSEQEKVVEQRDALKKLIREGQLEPIFVPRRRFGDYINSEYVPKLRKAAKESTKGGEQGVILRDPDFGLTDYLGGTLPENSLIPSLLLDLQTMEQMSLLLFEGGISELVVVKKVEEEQTRTRRGGPPVMNGFGGFQNDPTLMSNEPVVEEDTRSKLLQEKDRLFDWEDYRLEYRVYEDHFWNVLNLIMADSNQYVITQLSVTNSNEDLWPNYLEPTFGNARADRSQRPARRPKQREMNELEMLLHGGVDPAGVNPEEDSVVKIAGLAERRQNKVGGDLLNVVMVVRVYRLTEDGTEETQETVEGL